MFSSSAPGVSAVPDVCYIHKQLCAHVPPERSDQCSLQISNSLEAFLSWYFYLLDIHARPQMTEVQPAHLCCTALLSAGRGAGCLMMEGFPTISTST